MSGVLRGSAIASLHFRGGKSRGNKLLSEINGAEGDLLVSGAGGHVQMLELTLQGGRGEDAALASLSVPDEYCWVPSETPSGFPFNVAQLYVQLTSDMQEGTKLSLAFDEAIVRHYMLEAIQTAADSGVRQSYVPAL